MRSMSSHAVSSRSRAAITSACRPPPLTSGRNARRTPCRRFDAVTRTDLSCANLDGAMEVTKLLGARVRDRRRSLFACRCDKSLWRWSGKGRRDVRLRTWVEVPQGRGGCMRVGAEGSCELDLRLHGAHESRCSLPFSQRRRLHDRLEVKTSARQCEGASDAPPLSYAMVIGIARFPARRAGRCRCGEAGERLDSRVSQHGGQRHRHRLGDVNNGRAINGGLLIGRHVRASLGPR